MLYQTIEDHVLFLVDGHIPFKVPALGFNMISHCVKFLFGLGNHVVNIVWSQIVVDQGKVGCPTISSSQERFDVGPTSVILTDFSQLVKQGMVVCNECWVVGWLCAYCHCKVRQCPVNHLVQVVISIGFGSFHQGFSATDNAKQRDFSDPISVLKVFIEGICSLMPILIINHLCNCILIVALGLHQ